tara:strand:- start:537 stop:797 length:261 start_codon:yes stop_codon:yes gene_type:complete
MMSGDIIFPKKIPNLNQSLFRGVKTLEFKEPKTRKIKQIDRDHILISPPKIKGYNAIIKNTTKKTNPKFRLELILISLINKDYDNS